MAATTAGGEHVSVDFPAVPQGVVSPRHRSDDALDEGETSAEHAMTANDDNNRRSGPREHQTMSGVLEERRGPLPPHADRAPQPDYPPSVLVDQHHQQDAIPVARSAPEGGRIRYAR